MFGTGVAYATLPSYALPGADIGYGAIALRVRYAMPGTDIAYLAAIYAMSGTDLGYAALPAYALPTRCPAMSGTDIGYAATRPCDRRQGPVGPPLSSYK
eukprot:3668551-Rhodomonas_salina.1